MPPYSIPVSETAVSMAANEILRASRCLRTMPLTSARVVASTMHAAYHTRSALGLHDDAVRRDIQPDVVVLAEGRGVGKVGVDLADPQPVTARPVDVAADRITDQVQRLDDWSKRQPAHLHAVHVCVLSFRAAESLTDVIEQ